jgi:hypothetical protein
MRRGLKLGLAGGAAIAAFGVATTVPTQAAPATKAAPTYLIRVCITLSATAQPLCIQI